MFLDIRGFTTFSEGRPPVEVVDYLSTLFDALIASVNRHDGIINKFLGDGFMAVFGAPVSDGLDSQNAVAASLEMIAEVERMVAAGTLPPTRIGIGLHAGSAVTGNVGSHLRREYTVIGDVVNTASRIEGLNKQFASQLLVSDEVYSKLAAPPEGASRLEPVPVKGRAEPVQIWMLA
jgi:adenylate cyclase